MVNRMIRETSASLVTSWSYEHVGANRRGPGKSEEMAYSFPAGTTPRAAVEQMLKSDAKDRGLPIGKITEQKPTTSPGMGGIVNQIFINNSPKGKISYTVHWFDSGVAKKYRQESEKDEKQWTAKMAKEFKQLGLTVTRARFDDLPKPGNVHVWIKDRPDTVPAGIDEIRKKTKAPKITLWRSGSGRGYEFPPDNNKVNTPWR